MIDAVHLFLEVFDGIVKEFGFDPYTVKSEMYFKSSTYFGGTADFLIWNEHTIVVMDFKYGRKPVHASSPQLSCYLLMAITGLQLTPTRFVQVLVQPRSFTGETVSRHEPTLEQLTEIYRQVNESIRIVTQYEQATETPLELLKVGSHCEYCPKQAGCPAHFQLMSQVVEAATAPIPVSGAVEDISKLVEWLEYEDVVKGFFKAMHVTLLEHARAGREIPGKKLVPRFGNRQFAITETMTESKMKTWLAKQFGVPSKELTKTTLLSVAQIEDLFKEKGLFKENKALKNKFNEMIVRENKGVKLVDASARGDAISVDSISAYLLAMESVENNNE
jgi:hypothetical protein